MSVVTSVIVKVAEAQNANPVIQLLEPRMRQWQFMLKQKLSTPELTRTPSMNKQHM
jgi:hypothetical protein